MGRSTGAHNAELFHPRVERRGFHVEECGCAACAADAPAGDLEHLEDVPALHLSKRGDLGALWCRAGPDQPLAQLELPALAENHGALDDVLELAYVPGPAVGPKRVDCRLGNGVDTLARLGTGLHDEVPYEPRDVLGAIAERRQRDGEHVQPIIEIRPKPAVTDGSVQRVIRGRDDPDVHCDGVCGADPFERALLENAQELRL